MNKKAAFIFPGQGAQYVGMGRDFSQQYSTARETFEEADDLLGEKLSTLIFEGPSEQLTLTKHCQVAIYVVSIALLRVVQEQFPGLVPVVCGGLSLGEYTALTAAEKLDFSYCLPLVQARAQYMHEAALSNPGTMLVVLGMEVADLKAFLESESLSNEVWIANLNCPGQIVLSGTVAGIERAGKALKAQGKRALPLDVAGAFHSPLMEPAKKKLEPLISSLTFQQSAIAIAMNVPGGYVASAQEMQKCLIDQVTSSVLWQKCVESMKTNGVDLFVEIGPGKSLTGMNKRIGIGDAIACNIEKIADLDLLARSGS